MSSGLLFDFANSGNFPDDIPYGPNLTYKNNGWKSWGDFLGTDRISTSQFQFRSFTEAKNFVHSLNLKSQKEWQQYSKSEKRPKDIPGTPPNPYRKDWKGWGDFLGTGNIAARDIQFRSFTEAKKFFRSLGLKNQREWKEYVKSGKKPDDIPALPWVVYSKKNILRKMKKK